LLFAIGSGLALSLAGKTARLVEKVNLGLLITARQAFWEGIP